MKNRYIAALALLSCIALLLPAHAEMKLTPSGVTSEDNTAAIHLTGNFNTGNYAPDSSAAIISGVNKYSGDYSTCGGYFSASGYIGSGVFGSASGYLGFGIDGSATGTLGRGVNGYASGTSGTGVYGTAYRSGAVTNYGGYFTANGSSGSGVYGYASNNGDVINYGGYFETKGNLGYGVYGTASGSSGTGVYGYAGNKGDVTNYGGYFIGEGSTGRGVYGKGGEYDFYAAGKKTNFGPFTGAHEVKFIKNMREDIITGMIVSTTGKTEMRKDETGIISLSSTLPTVTLSKKANDKAVFGVIVSDGPLPKDHWYESQEGENFGVVNALGEGRVWVTNRNGDIENGDYVTTSEIPGYGQLQNDDLLHSYTLGKAIETIDWDQVADTIQHDGKIYKRYLLAVVYTSG